MNNLLSLRYCGKRDHNLPMGDSAMLFLLSRTSHRSTIDMTMTNVTISLLSSISIIIGLNDPHAFDGITHHV